MPNHQSMREAKTNKEYWGSITAFRYLLFKIYEENLITVYEPLNSLYHDPFDGAKNDANKKEKFRENVFNILTEFIRPCVSILKFLTIKVGPLLATCLVSWLNFSPASLSLRKKFRS